MQYFYKEEEDGSYQLASGFKAPEGFVEFDLDDKPEALNAFMEKLKETQAQQKVNGEALSYLKTTDWYVIRNTETGKAIPPEVTGKRAEARLKVNT